MSTQERYGEQDLMVQGRRAAVHAAVDAFEALAIRQYGQPVVQEGPVPAITAMGEAEAALLAQTAAEQSVAALSTQKLVNMSGAEDARAS